MKKLFFSLMAAACALTANAQGWVGETVQAGIDYYLYNVETGHYLSAGNNWGTRATLDTPGLIVTTAVSGSGYTLSTSKNGSVNTINLSGKFLGVDGYVDQGSQVWTFKNVGTESDPVYTLKNASGKFLYAGDINSALWCDANADESKAAAQWKLISKSARESLFKNATAANPIDVSYLIQDAGFINNSSNNRPRLYTWPGSLAYSYDVAERYHAAFDAFQEIDVPNGKYDLELQAFARLDGGSSVVATLYANSESTPLMNLNDETDLANKPNSMQAAHECFAQGYYKGNKVTVIVANGKLRVGVKTTVANEWVLFDNMKLTYYGFDLSELNKSLAAKIVAAKAISGKMNAAVEQSLADAIAAAENVAQTADAITKVAGDLDSAISDAEASIAVYSSVAAALAQTTPDAAAFAAVVAQYQDAYNKATITDGVDEINAINTAYQAEWCKVYATITPGDYLLQNVETGKYLGAANAWGTQASLLTRGILWNVEAAANGKYTLDSHIANNANDHYLTGTYTDGGATPFALIAVEGGYALTANNADFLTTPDNNIVDLSSKEMTGKAVWKLISKEDLYAQMTAATEEAPVDATVLVKDANFDRNNTGYSAWTWSFGSSNNNNNHNNAGDNSNFVVESFHAQFALNQSVSVPNGRYLVTAQGFYRQDGSDNEHLPYFFANDQKANVPAKSGEENSMANASTSFSNGLYKIEAMEVEVTDGVLNIGVSNMENDALWVIFDNFEVTCLGMAKSSVDVVANGYATFVAPFEVAVPAGVKAYTVDGVESDYATLVLTEVAAIAANTPVVLEGTCNETVEGFAFAEDAVKGLLTGVYEATPAPAGSYVLQNHADVVGFYLVGEVVPTVSANHAYLTVPAGSNVKAFYFGNDVATSISALDALTAGKAEIFDLNGRQQSKLQKGINIVNGVKVLVK